MSNRLLHNNLSSIFTLVSLFVLSEIFIGCGSDKAVKQLSAEEHYNLGMKAFKNEDYLDAIEEFKVVALQYQGSMVADSAQFYMAESRYLREEYILAAFEYDVLLRNMSSSVFVSRSRFKQSTCHYNLSLKYNLDQNYSRKAIDEYQAFLEYHPNDTLAPMAEQRIAELNTKLARKDYENGITYMHLEYYRAAAYYFDFVLEKYHDTQYAEPALFKKAEALTYRKKYAEAKEAMDKFFIKYPSSELKSDADKLYAEITAKMSEEMEQKKKALQPANNTNKQIPQSGG